MAAVNDNSNYTITARVGGATAVVLLALEMALLLKYWWRVRLLVDRAAEKEAVMLPGYTLAPS